MRTVSSSVSPLLLDVVAGSEKPTTEAPRRWAAASKLRRVRVEGSKKAVQAMRPSSRWRTFVRVRSNSSARSRRRTTSASERSWMLTRCLGGVMSGLQDPAKLLGAGQGRSGVVREVPCRGGQPRRCDQCREEDGKKEGRELPRGKEAGREAEGREDEPHLAAWHHADAHEEAVGVAAADAEAASELGADGRGGKADPDGKHSKPVPFEAGEVDVQAEGD